MLFPHRKFAKVLQLLAWHLLLLFLGAQPEVLGDANLQLPAFDHPEDRVEAGQDAGVDRGEQGHPRQGDESDQVQPKWLVIMIQFSILRETVEQGAHFRKTVGLNFRTIPDPFGSYLFRLPLQEVSFSTDSEPLARPGIDLSAPFEPEPEKEVESERIVRMVEPAPAPPAESSEKTEVLSRIANLRKEISEDDRYVKDTLKLRHEAKEKAAAVEEARRKR